MASYDKLRIIMKYYGYEAQREQYIEESSEGILAAQKCKRYGTKECLEVFKGEIADNLIMDMQMAIFLGQNDIMNIMEEKLDRQLDRIVEAEGVEGFEKIKGDALEKQG